MSQIDPIAEPNSAYPAELGDPHGRFQFPPWANYLVPAGVILAIAVVTYVPVVLSLGLSPITTDVGYQPKQPLPFSHELHAGQLKMDCRYCHSTVEEASFAAIPPTATCMNCHAAIKSESPLLTAVRESYTTGQSLNWIRVHDLPDFVYFNHSAHVNKGIGCVSCHGRIDQMAEIRQSQPISMGWCLKCHRQPEQHLRPRDQVTHMDWDSLVETGRSQTDLGRELKQSYHIRSMDSLTSCTTCHR